jgi:glycine C-acetyltransferase
MRTNTKYIREMLDQIKDSGLWKEERVITSPQGAHVSTLKQKDLLNFCANNYLGLSSDPTTIEVAKKSYDEWGYGLSSVRFIAGTQAVHKELEEELSKFLNMEDTILYSSCYDANGGLFETLLNEKDAIVSDELNHASIIDGIRLCKARRYRYKNNDMISLREELDKAQKEGARVIMIATDGVFSMDGTIANLKEICDIAAAYNAIVMVDDSHATGFIGKEGRGTHEYNEVMGRVDIITGTFGKALGGASGGFTSGRKEIIDLLRQRSRPYLFSNSLAPAMAATTLSIIKSLSETTVLRDRLEDNTKYFRTAMSGAGFEIPVGVHPIVPIMLGDALVAQKMAELLLKEGIYVVGFYYPVVPMGKSRIRVQISAAHTKEDIDKAVNAFILVKKQMNL